MAVYKYTTPDFTFEVSQNEKQKANNSYKLSVFDNYSHSATFDIYNEDESFLKFLNKNVTNFEIDCFSDVIKHLCDNGIQVGDIKVQMREVDGKNIDLWYGEFEKMSKLWSEPHNDFRSVEFWSTADDTKFKLTNDKQYSQFEFIHDNINYKNRYDKEKDEYFEDFNNAEISDYAILTTLSYSKSNYETFVYDNIVKEEQLKKEIENSNPFRKTKKQMSDFVQSLFDEIDTNKNIKDTKQIDRLVENINKREQKIYSRKEKREQVINPKLQSKKRYKVEEPQVSVDFTTDNEFPVIQIERSKNGVVEKLNVVIDGKALEADSKLYKALLDTKSPSDVMEVLSKENIPIKSFNADIQTNIPELLPNITNVIKKEIAMYNTDIDINIKATAGDYSTISKITGDKLNEYEVQKKDDVVLSIQNGVPVVSKLDSSDPTMTKVFSNSNSQLNVDYLKFNENEREQTDPEIEQGRVTPNKTQEEPEKEETEKSKEQKEPEKENTNEIQKTPDTEQTREKEEQKQPDTEKVQQEEPKQEKIDKRAEMEKKLFPNIDGIKFADIINIKDKLIKDCEEMAYDKGSDTYIHGFTYSRDIRLIGDLAKIKKLNDDHPKLFDETLTPEQKKDVLNFLNNNGLGVERPDRTFKTYDEILEILKEFNDEYKQNLYYKKDPNEPQDEKPEIDTKDDVNYTKLNTKELEPAL